MGKLWVGGVGDRSVNTGQCRYWSVQIFGIGPHAASCRVDKPGHFLGFVKKKKKKKKREKKKEKLELENFILQGL